jgi:acetoacetyl-CoA synthetase
MGAAPPWIIACRKADLQPGCDHGLRSLRIFGTAGSPPSARYHYLNEQRGPDVLIPHGTGVR